MPDKGGRQAQTHDSVFVTRSGSDKVLEQLGSDPSWVSRGSNQHKVVLTSQHLKNRGTKMGERLLH